MVIQRTMPTALRQRREPNRLPDAAAEGGLRGRELSGTVCVAESFQEPFLPLPDIKDRARRRHTAHGSQDEQRTERVERRVGMEGTEGRQRWGGVQSGVGMLICAVR